MAAAEGAGHRLAGRRRPRAASSPVMPGRAARPAATTRLLRGAQATNSDGIVEFKTIYPGWYRGRTTHIHAKVHLDKATLLTTQFFTTKAMDDVVYVREPCSEDTGRDTFNESDNIYVEEGELTLSEDGESVVGLITLDVKRSKRAAA